MLGVAQQRAVLCTPKENYDTCRSSRPSESSAAIDVTILLLYIQIYVVASESIGADGSSTPLPHTVRIAVWSSGRTLGTAGGQIVLRASIEERPLRRLPMRDLRCL